MMKSRPATPSASADGAGPTRVLLVGGTSAGHLAPMVAVAEALETIEPGIRLSFVCSDRAIDTSFLSMEKRAYSALPIGRDPFSLFRAFTRSLAILKETKPDVVFSKGSVVSVPLCLAAWMKRIPIILHESDSVMGRANRAVAMVATKVCLGMSEDGKEEMVENGKEAKTTLYPSPPRFVFTGNPIRARVTAGKKEEGLRVTGFGGTKPTLLVMGGSQGARAINECVVSNLDAILRTCDVIHLTGPGKKDAGNRPGYYATEFGSDVLPHLYAITTLAVSRAGAGSIAELAMCGIPAILVPIEGLAGDHQVKNAEAAKKNGTCIVLPQERIADLPTLALSIVADPVSLQTMRDACRYAAKPEAARLIAETVLRSVARASIGA